MHGRGIPGQWQVPSGSIFNLEPPLLLLDQEGHTLRMEDGTTMPFNLTDVGDSEYGIAAGGSMEGPSALHD